MFVNLTKSIYLLACRTWKHISKLQIGQAQMIKGYVDCPSRYVLYGDWLEDRLTNGDFTEVGGCPASVRDDHYFRSYPRTMYLQIKRIVSAENRNATNGFVKLNKLKEIRDNFGGGWMDPGIIQKRELKNRPKLILYLYCTDILGWYTMCIL